MNLLRRLGLYLLAAWSALTLNFLLPRMMPGDPAQALFARFQGRLDPAAMDALKVTLGLSSEPWPYQYAQYLSGLLHGDLGISLVYFPEPVSGVIATGIGWTLFLAGGTLIIAFLLGSAIGAWAAWRRGGWVDTLVPPLFSFLGAFPYFWLAMAAVWLFAFQAGWFPVRSAYGPEVQPAWTLAFVASVGRHALLPAITMVVASLGGWILTMRNAMLGVMGDEPIRAAQARGISAFRMFFFYAVRGAMLPGLTSFGMALGFVFSGALMTEMVFSYPGQGYLLLQAVRGQDYPLLQGLFLSITLAVLGANAMVDLVVNLLDPRARE